MNLSDELNKVIKQYAVGNKLSAYKKFKKIYLQNNKNINMRYNLAVMQQELGFFDEAEENYKSLIKTNSDLKSKTNLYILYFSKELFEKALTIIKDLEKENSTLTQINQDKAYALFRLKNYEGAINECKKILKKENKNLKVLNTLGLSYLSTKKYNEANNIFLKAIKIDINNIEVLNSLGRLNHEIRNSHDAEVYFLKALKINPEVFETLNNIAGFYLEEGEYSKALKFYKHAEILRPKNSTVINNIAKTYLSIGKIKNAENYCKKALKLENKNSDINKTFALILLKKYDFKKAWMHFDGRLGLSDFINKNTTLNYVKEKIPKNNNININSKILVLREQGVGDELLYGTMYSDLFKKYNNVIIESDKRLIDLFKNSFRKEDCNKFVELGYHSKNKNSIEKFDYVIYAGSLGRFFRTSKESFTGKHYLTKINNYQDKELDSIIEGHKGLKIGLSWKSFNNRYAKEKSLELNNFELILKKENSIFFNLQYGDINNEINLFNKSNNKKIITLKNLDLFNDFNGLANLLSKLDIFITVSNSTAHLAGALGIKTLLIKPENHAAYHYWDYEDGKTPWYDSISIIKFKHSLNYTMKLVNDLIDNI